MFVCVRGEGGSRLSTTADCTATATHTHTHTIRTHTSRFNHVEILARVKKCRYAIVHAIERGGIVNDPWPHHGHTVPRLVAVLQRMWRAIAVQRSKTNEKKVQCGFCELTVLEAVGVGDVAGAEERVRGSMLKGRESVG